MSYFCLHMQDPVDDWIAELAKAHAAGSPFRLIKSFHAEDHQWALGASPGILFVLRHWADDVNQDRWLQMAGENPEQADRAADEFLLRFAESARTHLKMSSGRVYVESLNEQYPTGNTTVLRQSVAFDRAFIRRLPVHIPGALPIVFTAAIGNPGHNEYGELVPLARECANANGAFGYHAYWTVANQHSYIWDEGVTEDLHGRWVVIDNYMLQRGIRLNWMLGEVGATYSEAGNGYGPSVLAGWREARVWGGDLDDWIEDVAEFDQYLASTPVARSNRLLGATHFTSRPGSGGTWEFFNINGGALQRFGDYVAANPSPGPGPGPGPDPFRQALWEAAQAAQLIRFNPDAALQGAIFQTGAARYVPNSNEFPFNWENQQYVCQRSELLDRPVVRVYYVPVGDWDNVQYEAYDLS